MTPPLSKFEFVSIDREEDGILYWLGTNQGASDYKNPHDMGLVSVTGASSSSFAVDKSAKGDAGWCNDARNKYFTIDLKGIQVFIFNIILSFLFW